jgi:NTP pyrophosphatase (non-canonical NTP hydrolase)
MNDVLKDIINLFGEKQQMIVAMEECSELIKEISKYLRGKSNRDNIIEEVADVLIMIKYLQLILNISDEELNEMKQFKINRTKNKYIKEGK